MQQIIRRCERDQERLGMFLIAPTRSVCSATLRHWNSSQNPGHRLALIEERPVLRRKRGGQTGSVWLRPGYFLAPVRGILPGNRARPCTIASCWRHRKFRCRRPRHMIGMGAFRRFVTAVLMHLLAVTRLQSHTRYRIFGRASGYCVGEIPVNSEAKKRKCHGL